jgi:hypothetical protein
MLYKKIIAVHSENYIEPISTLCEQSTELLVFAQAV